MFEEPLRKLSESEVEEMGLKCYNSDVHKAAFVLPQFAKKVNEHGCLSYKFVPILLKTSFCNVHTMYLQPKPPTVLCVGRQYACSLVLLLHGITFITQRSRLINHEPTLNDHCSLYLQALKLKNHS